MYEDVLKQIAYDYEIKLGDLCFSISTKNFDFPFSYYAFENDDFLAINVTDENGLEKLHLIVKSEIVFLKIIYMDDMEILLDEEDINKHEVDIYE